MCKKSPHKTKRWEVPFNGGRFYEDILSIIFFLVYCKRFAAGKITNYRDISVWKIIICTLGTTGTGG